MRQLSVVDERLVLAFMNDPTTARRRLDSDAACADAPSFPYHPEDRECPSADALALCLECPVRQECLATALHHEATAGYRDGWWGGFSPEDRDRLARELRIDSPAVEDDDPANRARSLRADGLTVSSIAFELGCTERTAYRYLAASAA